MGNLNQSGFDLTSLNTNDLVVKIKDVSIEVVARNKNYLKFGRSDFFEIRNTAFINPT